MVCARNLNGSREVVEGKVNKEKNQDDIKENNALTILELALRHGITKDTCWRIVKENLDLKM